MTKIQEIRDRLEKGTRVNVLLKVSEGVVKRKPGVVVDVKRAAATIRFENEVNPRTVRFNEIEIPDPPKPPPVKLVPKPDPVASAPAIVAPEHERSSFETWLDMGAEIEGDLEQTAALLRAEKAALEAEQSEILMALEAVTARYAEAHESLEAIRKIRRARAS